MTEKIYDTETHRYIEVSLFKPIMFIVLAVIIGFLVIRHIEASLSEANHIYNEGQSLFLYGVTPVTVIEKTGQSCNSKGCDPLYTILIDQTGQVSTTYQSRLKVEGRKW